MDKPLQIGITGGIGSGKSVVCRILACLGVPVYEADERARWLTNHDPQLRQEVVALLGPQAYTTAGAYDRAYVASRVFGDPVLLNKLNHIVHPRVFADSDRWIARYAQVPYVVREAALMNKAGDKNTLDYVVVVNAPVQLRFERTRKRDPQRSDEEIRAIMQRQVPDEERLRIADFVIYNDDSTALIPQVLHLHQLILEKRGY
ncbi:dephospho-CoA kinase [Telluribacter sp. SYSU D00476]|uniref:dephospho-CoA kinase n=1 Tax=Telluribacter sp. SYSU D00476 TaxID=2811430 RepID=UPI001FF600D0|nr:dephospho-CoA kinase [Telluribacter sp. SYSU D00476]